MTVNLYQTINAALMCSLMLNSFLTSEGLKNVTCELDTRHVSVHFLYGHLYQPVGRIHSQSIGNVVVLHSTVHVHWN